MPKNLIGRFGGNRYEVNTAAVEVELNGGDGNDVYVLGSESGGPGRAKCDFRVSISDRGGKDILIVNEGGVIFANEIFGSPFILDQLVYTVTDKHIARNATDTTGLFSYQFDIKVSNAGLEDVRLYGA